MVQTGNPDVVLADFTIPTLTHGGLLRAIYYLHLEKHGRQLRSSSIYLGFSKKLVLKVCQYLPNGYRYTRICSVQAVALPT